jgi:hypothetical protein
MKHQHTNLIRQHFCGTVQLRTETLREHDVGVCNVCCEQRARRARRVQCVQSVHVCNVCNVGNALDVQNQQLPRTLPHPPTATAFCETMRDSSSRFIHASKPSIPFRPNPHDAPHDFITRQRTTRPRVQH